MSMCIRNDCALSCLAIEAKRKRRTLHGQQARLYLSKRCNANFTLQRVPHICNRDKQCTEQQADWSNLASCWVWDGL